MVNRINLIVLIFTMVFSFFCLPESGAGNASWMLVDISYPCDDNQDDCDTGEAISREVNGDKVNVYITLLDDSGGPATTGPFDESLETLTASCLSNLGSINANSFASDAGFISFNGDASARANVDYTGSTPGVDQIICVVSATPEPLVGWTYGNVVTSSSLAFDGPHEEEATGLYIQQEGPQNIYCGC